MSNADQLSYVDQLVRVMPEVILSVSGLIALMVAAYAKNGGVRIVNGIAIVALAAAGLSLCGPSGNAGPLFNGLYSSDWFATFAKVLIYIAAGVSIIMASGYFARDRGPGTYDGLRPEYAILILYAALGMSVMVSATDMMTLYVGLELNSLAAYVLASFMRTDQRSAEAGLKYFVLGALASGILLYGITLLYGYTGSTSFAGIANGLSGEMQTGALFGLVLTLCGLAFKISAVPFHMWTPDVYEGAPTPVTAFFASAPKVAAVAVTMRIAIEAMGSQTAAWQQIIIFAALASIFLGGLAGIGQTNIKRLLAYSSIANVGYMLIGLAAATPQGVAAVLVNLAIYVVMTLGTFLCILAVRDPEGRPLEQLSDFAGLSQQRPGIAAAMAVFMFSMAGIPPLFGFWGKLLVFNAAVDAGFFGVAVAGFIGSVIATYYYLKIIKLMYFDDANNSKGHSTSTVETVLITLGVLAMFPLGWFATQQLGIMSMNAAQSLF